MKCWGLLVCLILFGGYNQKEASLPNVLLIVTDDQGYGDVGYNGNETLETPELDRLAKNSIVFDRFYVSPVCAPTRASLLTGKYHLSTGVSWVTHRKEVMRQSETTLAEYLRSKGYTTGLFGKWHNGSQYPHDPLGQGFDRFVGFKDGHFNNYFDPRLFNGSEQFDYEGYLPDIITEKAVEFIQSSEEPFFGMVTFNTPHGPFQVPDQYFDKYKSKGLEDRLAAIYGMVENIDTNVGRIIHQLESSGKLENTLIFFVGDNGPNGTRFNGGLKGIKSHVDEGGVRVPALLSFPARGWNTGERIGEMAAHIDLLPTITAIVGGYDLKVDGVDLAEVINGEHSGRPFFTHQVIRKFDRYPGAVRQGGYLLTIKNESNSLYNLTIDEGQSLDVADSFPQLTAELREKYETWITESIGQLGEPELIEIGHEEAPLITFQAQEVQSRHNVDFQGKEGWSNDYLINFSDSSEIKWETKSVANSDFSFSMQLSALPGTEITIQVDSLSLTRVIDNPKIKKLIPSLDRVARGEVYEYEWPTLDFGSLPIKRGVHTLTVLVHDSKDLEIKSLQLLKNE